MINIKELSIGNWVKLNRFNKMGKILGVNEDSVITNIAYPVLLEDIEPIPITPEILKKNGWEVRINDINPKKWMAYLVEEGAFIFKGSDLATLNTNTGKEIPFRYVHQLQNALILCGINKRIEL